MSGPEQRWIATVDLYGEITDPKPYSGPRDNGRTTLLTSYGTSYQGIGTSPEDARASATEARKLALPDLQKVLDHLEDTAAGAQLSLEAAEPVPGVGAYLMEEVRSLLGTQLVPPGLGRVSRDMLIEWTTELSRAVGGDVS